MGAANAYLHKHYRAAFNLEFMQPAHEGGSALCPARAPRCRRFCAKHFERVVRPRQLPDLPEPQAPDPACIATAATLSEPRCACVAMSDDTLAIFHGPRCLARYSAQGQPIEELERAARNVRRGVAPILGPRATPSAPGSATRLITGQSMCYRTRQFYLLLNSALQSLPIPKRLTGFVPAPHLGTLGGREALTPSSSHGDHPLGLRLHRGVSLTP